MSGASLALAPGLRHNVLLHGADLKHLGAAHAARAFDRRFAILHRDGFRVLDLALLFTLHAMAFHSYSPL